MILIVENREALVSSQWKLPKRQMPRLLRSTARNLWERRLLSLKLAEVELVPQHPASIMVPQNVVPKATVPMIQGRTTRVTLGTGEETITVVVTGTEEIVEVGGTTNTVVAAGMIPVVGEMIIEEEEAEAEEGEIEVTVETAIMIMIEAIVTEVVTDLVDLEICLFPLRLGFQISIKQSTYRNGWMYKMGYMFYGLHIGLSSFLFAVQ